ncbi:iron transporter [Calderihabitans maritimus]
MAMGFQEFPIGDPQEVEGMEIAAVYFQPVTMWPENQAGLSPEEADIHIEADIRALKNNKLGFGFGEFIPYLTVHYKLKNLDNGQKQEGTFMPMVASDGPHYGANIKMMGAGQYELTYIIEAPESYLLPVDKETGVEGRWWQKPIEVKWTFTYLGRKW